MRIHSSWVAYWVLLSIATVVGLAGFGGFDAYRLVAIAHTMLNQHEYLLPHWQSHLYAQKPPLLFWLFIAGWKITGFNYWWPQLLVMLVGAGSMFMTVRITQQLWPSRLGLHQLVPIVLMGMYFWLWSAKQVDVDALVVFFMLAAVSALISARSGNHRAWVWYALAVGLAGMAKGPVIFVFILPPLFFLPRWQLHETHPPSCENWYRHALLATALGVALTLCWAIPAAIEGGQAYARSIFYGQIIHRQHSHNEYDFLYYVKRLPFDMLPWVIYAPVWYGISRHFHVQLTDRSRLIWSIIITALLVFSIFGQKEPHYIYPILPFLAVAIALAIREYALHKPQIKLWFQWPLAVMFIILGLTLFLLPHVQSLLSINGAIRGYFLLHVPIVWPFALLLVGLVLACYCPASLLQQVSLLAIGMLVFQLFINMAVIPNYMKFYLNPTDTLIYLDQAVKEKTPVALYAVKDKEFLAIAKHANLPLLRENSISAWRYQHPTGLLITESKLYFVKHYQHIKPVIWFYSGRTKVIAVWK